MFFLHYFLLNLDHKAISVVWFCIEWLIFLATIFLLGNLFKNQKIKYIFIAIGLLSTISVGWLFHLSTGQLYIVYVFLAALIYWILEKVNFLSEEVAGLLLGILTALRLPYLLLIIPLFIYGKRKMVVFTALSFIVMILFSINSFGMKMWQSYFSAMERWSNNYLNNRVIVINPDMYYPVESEPKEVISRNEIQLKNDTSIKGWLKWNLNVDVNPKILFGIFSLAILLSAVILKTVIPEGSLPIIYLYGTLLVYLAEFFIPAPRYNYNNVQFILPAFLITEIISGSKNWKKEFRKLVVKWRST